jgi:hypothetical protein
MKGIRETKVPGQFLDPVQHLDGCVKEFRPDAVAGDHHDVVRFHKRYLNFPLFCSIVNQIRIPGKSLSIGLYCLPLSARGVSSA